MRALKFECKFYVILCSVRHRSKQLIPPLIGYLAVALVLGCSSQESNPYPKASVGELEVRLSSATNVIDSIRSDQEFEMKWVDLKENLYSIDDRLNRLLEHAYESDGQLTEQDYTNLVAFRESFLESVSRLETRVNAENLRLVKGGIQLRYLANGVGSKKSADQSNMKNVIE